MKLHTLLISQIFLAACLQAQPAFIQPGRETPYDEFLPACHDDSYCTLTCDVMGPNANNDPEYYYCTEPDSCDGTDLTTRTITGVCNNIVQGRRLRGSIGHLQLVRVEGEFQNVVSPRQVSDVVGAFAPTIPNVFGRSTALIMFGQFIDHDVTVIHLEPAGSIIIPGSGIVPDMLFQPSEAVGAESRDAPFHINDLTSYLDLSSVYGSEDEVTDILRANENGLMLTRIGSDGREFLPLVADLPIDDSNDDVVALGFLPGAMAAGDIRVNEHLTLIAWHTLFVREHNRLAREILAANPELRGNDEELFQRARKWNIAQYQNIVFGEYFRGWHDEDLPPYTGYNETETPDVDIYFSSVTYRIGHSGIPNEVLRIDEEGNTVSLPLGEVFFRPSQIEMDGGIDGLFNGATQQCHERIDTYFQDGIRNALFNDIPGLQAGSSPAMDLYTLNVQRARDHRIGSYPAAREFFGLPEVQTFDEVSGNRPCVTELLESLYGVDNVEGCDPLVCALAEPATRGQVGELMYASQLDHFRRFRDADRFFFENRQGPDDDYPGPQFTDNEILEIRAVRMHDIIARNTFMQADDPNAPNYIQNAFLSDRCARNDGVQAFLRNENRDQICVPNGEDDQFTLQTGLAQCDATVAVREGQAFFPASPECSSTCMCPGLGAEAAPRMFGSLTTGGLVGLIVGLILGFILIGGLGFFFWRRRKMARELDYTQGDQLSVGTGTTAASAAQGFGGPSSVHSQAPAVNNYF